MPRPTTLDEDVVLLNLARTHTIEEICRELARPKEAIEMRLAYLRNKDLIGGVDGDVVMKSQTSDSRPNALQQATMEKSTYTSRV